ncbi:hypothetical protein E0K83_06425 [Gramella sp. BOM4]|nr:hypothetical protein [Christiangramia bathymodioli]
MNEEIWKPIKGYENRYLISNWGRIKSLGRTIHAKDGSIRNYKDRMLSLKPNKSRGYISVRLCKKDWRQWGQIDVHRLVALHFIPNPDGHPVVNHKDCNRSNNHIDNLEWVSISTNLTHEDAHLRAGKSRRKQVYQYTLNGEFIRSWSWASETALEGFYPNCVTKVCGGFKPHYRGYFWSYQYKL